MASTKKQAASKQSVSLQSQISLQSTVSQQHLVQQVKANLVEFFTRQQLANPEILVAFSGGLDSVVLLHLLVQIKQVLPFNLAAMHVHHGLSTNADHWTQFCAEVCKHWQVPFSVMHVQVDSKSGLGVEATARAARYQALANQKADFICLAHHQDDQAETLLLQLARGSGAKGLAAMAPYDVKRKLLRPLLTIQRADLENYAKFNQLNWIEDESNDDAQYDRNFVRHQLLPIFKQRYPAISQTLARSASHLAEAASLCEDLAKIDAIEAVTKKQLYQTLNLEKIKHLSQVRQINLLRWWLAQLELSMPSAAQMQQIIQQVFHSVDDAVITIKVSQDYVLKRYQKHIYLVKVSPESPLINRVWQGESELVLPDQSRLTFTQQFGVGLALKKLEGHTLSVQTRQGGEYLYTDLSRPSRSLKTIFNHANVPPWPRPSWPLLFLNGKLAIIPNIAADIHLKAADDELGLKVDWVDATGRLMWLM